MGYPLSALDQTRDFVVMLRAQIGAGVRDPNAAAAFGPSSASPDPRRQEIALLASEGARFTSRLLYLFFDALGQVQPPARQGEP